MSVINKMLRDLDQRETARLAPLPGSSATTGVAQGTRVVMKAPEGGRRAVAMNPKLLIAGLVLVLLGAALWAWFASRTPAKQEEHSAALAPPAQTAQKSAVVEAAQPVAAQTKAALPANKKMPGVSGAVAAASLTAASLPKTQPSPEPLLAKAGTKVVAPQAVLAAAQLAAAAQSKPAASVLAVPAASSTVPVVAAPAPVSPAMEALAQAQLLWNSSANDAAIDLLDQALSSAERGAPSAAAPATVAALARELARMLLAQGRVSQALERLTQLEPLLAEVADIWATRGNAAQRLGRHQESVNAYLMALKLRPDEPRWMLGAAVSLAAQGQTGSAAEYAEQARQAGVLRPEVATYLRQLGVSLR